jgi:hypothetical protein
MMTGTSFPDRSHLRRVVLKLLTSSSPTRPRLRSMISYASSRRSGLATRTTTRFANLEDQTSRCCQEYFRGPGALSVYACTLVGAGVRCWVAHRNNDAMDGLWWGGLPTRQLWLLPGRRSRPEA